MIKICKYRFISALNQNVTQHLAKSNLALSLRALLLQCPSARKTALGTELRLAPLLAESQVKSISLN